MTNLNFIYLNQASTVYARTTGKDEKWTTIYINEVPPVDPSAYQKYDNVTFFEIMPEGQIVHVNAPPAA